MQSELCPPAGCPPPPRRPAVQPAGRTAISLLLLAVTILIHFTACATERSEKRKLRESIAPPQPLLHAAARYGDGTLAIEAWLGPTVRLRKTDGEPGGTGEEPAAAGHQHPDAARASAGPPDISHAPFEQGPGRYSAAEIDRMYGHENYQYVLPFRLALTFTLTNSGPATCAFTIVEASSLLGNYAPRPDRYTLAPGQQGVTDPMLSVFESNFDALEVTLTLRFGHQTETQVLRLGQISPRAPPAPAAPSGG